MLYYFGVLIIFAFNVAIFYDQAQHNEEIYKSNFNLFLAVLSFFCIMELLFFSAVYVLISKIIGIT